MIAYLKKVTTPILHLPSFFLILMSAPMAELGFTLNPF